MILLKTPRAASELFLVKWALVLNDVLAVLMPQPSDTPSPVPQVTPLPSAARSSVIGVDRQARLCSSNAILIALLWTGAQVLAPPQH